MAYNPTTPVVGASVTGLTSPTYTLSEDSPPRFGAEQHAVTALGGTQTGVDAHSVSKPFTVTFMKPVKFKVLGTPDSAGRLFAFPRNNYELLTRKGVSVLDGQPEQICQIRTTISVPAGADSVDPEDIRAALSCHVGVLDDQSTGISDSVIDGII